MLIRIDPNNRMPVYNQIVEQVKRALATGVIRPGDPLPSLRETAIKLRINPLTVGKAYKMLEAEGVIETRHGAGSFVRNGALDPASKYSTQLLETKVDELVIDALHLGVSLTELQEIIAARMEDAKSSLPEKLGDENIENS